MISQNFISYLEKSHISFSLNEPLSEHTSFKIGGNAAVFVEASDNIQLHSLIEEIKKEKLKYFVIGRGTNLLVSDDGYDGVVISLGGDFSKAYVFSNTVTAGAGLPLIQLCTFALRNSLSGLEFAYGIPGSVGGAVFMNAGAYGGEIKDTLVHVTSLSPEGRIIERDADELDLGYRRSMFEENGEIILSATFALQKGEESEIKAKMNKLMSRRKEKQPLEFPSAGSTFKRPEGHFAGALIENAGLKGFSVGGAAVSEKHAGFVVNKGGASCADILAVIDHCRKTVEEQTGVKLETEVKFIC